MQVRIAKTPFWCVSIAEPGPGFISNGRIFIGRNGNVGEIGHIQVEPLGERCHCGNFRLPWKLSLPTPLLNNGC